MNNHSSDNSASLPFTVSVTRGSMVESRHLVSAAVCDSASKMVRCWGKVDSPVYLRSAIKPLQALPLVESGAADAFNVSEKELSLACASHTGEPIHVEAVTGWLERLGLGIEDLECGTHWPTYDPAARALAAAGQEPSPAHNNCSGKHSGFLCTAVHLKDQVKGYINREHPVQRRIVAVLEEFTDLDLSKAPIGIDGCSIPTIGIPLQQAALAFARFADPSKLSADRAAACARLQKSIAKYPEMIAGSDRLCTAINGAAKGRVIAKVGAEGVYLAALPEDGIGIAIKAADGTTRAVEVALGAILDELGVLDDDIHRAIDPFVRPILRNRNDLTVGEIRADLEG
ncbi:asparaginase [Sneathiella sp. HT1-7]|jgi:L-asparaginase II|uniref:asparaginase n=1 Tax=Sneathiella sp. HT1-7 TaxID=2887192 RepID=UPI001D15DB18|nr:asparaginase [Sneathiella sp. HT1-7]MCC3303297.1 asparaginase [Sneathiella sp. HT1-7]